MPEALLDLATAVLQAGVRWLPVMAAALLLTWALKRRSARERHAVWLIALCGLAALPLLGGKLPMQVSVAVPDVLALGATLPDATASVDEDARAPVERDGEATRHAAGEAPALDAEAEPPTIRRSQQAPGVPDADDGPLSTAVGPPGQAPSIPPWPGRLALLWAVGAGLLAAFELLSLCTTGALGREARAVAPDELPAGLDAEGRVPTVLSGGTGMPILFGIRRPRILLPVDWPCWPESWLRAVILHERAHALRGDVVVLAAARLVRAFFWPHPGAWLAVRRLRQEAELATDERVVTSGMNRFDYAEALLGLARHLGVRRIPIAGLATASPSGIHRRLLHIVESDPRRRRTRKGATLAVAAPILFVCLAVAAPSGRVLPAVAWLEELALEEGGTHWRAVCPDGDEPCSALTDRAGRLLLDFDGGGAVAVQDVGTGRVVAYAFVDRGYSLPAVPAVPVTAVAGLPMAAAWWEAGLEDRPLPCPAVINVSGIGAFANTNGLDAQSIDAPRDVMRLQCATAAIAMGATMVRDGPAAVAQSFARWGFAPGSGETFWAGERASAPSLPEVPLHPAGEEATWILAGSVHGSVRTTPLHLTRFLQAVANDGRMIRPAPPRAAGPESSVALLTPATAERLLDALKAGAWEPGEDARAGATGSAFDAGGDAHPRPLLAGLNGPGLLTVGGSAGDVFAGLLLEDGAPTYAVAVWLPRGRVDDGDRARPGASRALAYQVLAPER